MVKFAARQIVLGGALVATIFACFYPSAAEPDGHAARTVRASAAPLEAASTPAAFAEPASIERVDVDPFASRGWQPAPPAVETPVAAAPQAMVGPVPPAPAPSAPPLPFQFMGQLTDNGKRVVYLSRGDTTLIVRTGETLEQTYKVLNIAANQIEFEYLPTGEKQLMSLPAADY